MTFERSTETQSATGEPTDSWATLGEVAWARIVPTEGIERFAAMQVQGEAISLISCRYQVALDDLNHDDRVTWDGKVFDIKSVVDIGELNRELQVFVRRHI